jgi:hypothetical protein
MRCHTPGDTEDFWLDIPVGAVSGDTLVYFGVVPDADIPSPTAVPDGFDRVVKATEFGPDGSTFGAPMSMTLYYTDAEVSGIAEHSLSAFYYSPGSGIWVPVSGCAVDPAENAVTFQTTHFSMYGLGGQVAAPVPASSPWALGALTLAAFGVLARRMRVNERVA